MELGVGLQIVIDGAGDLSVHPLLVLVTVTIAVSLLEVSAWLVATTLCVPFVAGAVYKPEGVIVPTVLLPPPTPSTVQVTAVFEVFNTVAVNCCVPLGASVTELGETATETGAVPVPDAVTITVLLDTAPLESHALMVMLCFPFVSVSEVLTWFELVL